jgi:hypothetical protein
MADCLAWSWDALSADHWAASLAEWKDRNWAVGTAGWLAAPEVGPLVALSAAYLVVLSAKHWAVRWALWSDEPRADRKDAPMVCTTAGSLAGLTGSR